MSKNEGKVLFKTMKRSERSLEADELISLISATTVSRQALQRLTANILRNDLGRLEKNKTVKVKETSVLSATAPQKFYFTSKFNVKNAKSIDLISYAIYALRQYAKVGRVSIKENGNAIVDMVINENTYSNLEFISLDVNTYERKLIMSNRDDTQKVLVVNGVSLYNTITTNHKNALKDKLVIVVEGKNTTLTYQAAELITQEFDFNKLKHSKGAQIVSNIVDSYQRAETARRNSNLKNVNRRD